MIRAGSEAQAECGRVSNLVGSLLGVEIRKASWRRRRHLRETSRNG